MQLCRLALFLVSLLLLSYPVRADSGTEGAAFLNIPVGAGPAAQGFAYSARANDAYAPALNPGGLGFLQSTQLAGQHLAYLNSNHYEYLSFAHPLKPGRALGISAQYLGSGDIAGSDADGNTTGDFSSHYAAYNLAYGQTVGDKLSLGLTGKWITAKIDDVTARAFAADVGAMYRPRPDLTLAAVLTNWGSKLKFLNEGDSLPMAFHLGAVCQATRHWSLSLEGIYRKTGLISGHIGLEWQPVQLLTMRTGYRTDTVKELSALAGFTTGVGLSLWGQELAYAWLPVGDLGNSHYISFLARFGGQDDRRTLIQYRKITVPRSVKQRDGSSRSVNDASDYTNPDYEQMMELLSEKEDRLSQRPGEKRP